ncbi:MAG: hypothetical protein COA84_13685 [Robiginitomaculum sp.]|nr:MAG: hypothetical protein COA84_13685 [Robiginitomaculum sp.]
MLNFNKFVNQEPVKLDEEVDILLEKLILFSNGKKTGQIVFLSGGAGSGKGFASSKFMESEKFKVRDVDEWKKALIKIDTLKGKFPEIRGLDLKNPLDVMKMHKFVTKLKIKEKTLTLLLNDLRADRLPNIMFDITGKSIKDFEKIIPGLIDAGYSSRNIHISWILTDFKVAFVANLTRKRVVPADVFLQTHRGANKTMSALLDTHKMPKGADGTFIVVLNNRENTINFVPGEKFKGKTIPPLSSRVVGGQIKKIQNIKGFYSITVKDQGKGFRNEKFWKAELFRQIVANVPGGTDTIDSLIDHGNKELKYKK